MKRNPADIIFDSERYRVECTPNGYELRVDGITKELTGARATAFMDDYTDSPEPERAIDRHFT